MSEFVYSVVSLVCFIEFQNSERSDFLCISCFCCLKVPCGLFCCCCFWHWCVGVAIGIVVGFAVGIVGV